MKNLHPSTHSPWPSRTWIGLLSILLSSLLLTATAGAQLSGSSGPTFLDEEQRVELMAEGDGWKEIRVFDPNEAGDTGEELVAVWAHGISSAPLSEKQKEELREDFGITGGIQPSAPSNDVIVIHSALAEAVDAGAIPPEYEQYQDLTESCFGWNDKEKDKTWTLDEFSDQETFDLTQNVTGSYSIQLPLEGQATLEFKYRVKEFACVPYKFRFREARIFGNVNFAGDSSLVAQAEVVGDWDAEWPLFNPRLGSITFLVGPFPVYIEFHLPTFAGVELDTRLTGSLGLDSDFSASGSFDYTCNSDTCWGSSQFDDSFSSDSVTASLELEIDARAYARMMLRAEVYDDALLYVEAGIKGFVEAELWGYYGNTCGDADGDGDNETVEALAVDAQAGYDWVYGLGGILPDRDWSSNGGRYHLGWWDLLGQGGSTALQPMLLGPETVTQGEEVEYTVKMRPCYHYSDQVNFNMSPGTWTGATTIPKPKGTDPAQNSRTVSTTFSALGPQDVRAMNWSDSKGRQLRVPFERQITVVEAESMPQITLHPEPQVAAPGGTAIFQGQATGNGLYYRWQKDGVSIYDGGKYSGTNSPTLTISNVQTAELGAYRLRVNNSVGFVFSNPAQLSFQAAPQEVTVLPDVSSPGTVVVVGDPSLSATLTPAGQVNGAIPGWDESRDGVWSAASDLFENSGLDVITSHSNENAPLMSVTVQGLSDGSIYAVYGRYATAQGPNVVGDRGLAMGLTPGMLLTYDENLPTTVLRDWGIWEEREVCLGTAVVSGGAVGLHFDDPPELTRTSWSGMRLVLDGPCN